MGDLGGIPGGGGGRRKAEPGVLLPTSLYLETLLLQKLHLLYSSSSCFLTLASGLWPFPVLPLSSQIQKAWLSLWLISVWSRHSFLASSLFPFLPLPSPRLVSCIKFHLKYLEQCLFS